MNSTTFYMKQGEKKLMVRGIFQEPSSC